MLFDSLGSLLLISLLVVCHICIFSFPNISGARPLIISMKNCSQKTSSLGMVREFGNINIIKAFYASLKAKNTQTKNESVRTRPSEETQKAMQILKDFVSKKFSLLLHPGRFRLMKDTLKYLLSLAPDEGFSMTTKSLILQLSQCFDQWSLDYENASLKLDSATADLSEAEKVNGDFEANVKEFQEIEKKECLCKQLTYLLEEKRELEEKINAIKAKIADSTAMRNKAAKRKVQLFQHVERKDLRNQVPKLKAEQEWAKMMKIKIEEEWLKIGKQFIDNTDF